MRGRNAQLDFRAGTKLAPDGQLTAYEIGALAHAMQTKMSGTTVAAEYLRIDSRSVIADSQPELTFIIADFHFDLVRLCVAEGIAHRLTCDPIDFVPKDRMKIPRPALHGHTKYGGIGCVFRCGEVLFLAPDISL